MSEIGDAEEKTLTPSLIDKATNSTANEVDPRLLKAIKSAARSSDLEIRAAVAALTSHIRRPHSHVRYLSLLIVDQLFCRSKLFRSLLVPDLDQFLSFTVGFRRDRPLPPPAASASLLRSKSIELLEKWNAEFGLHYRQLRLGFDYLKNTLRFQFPNQIEAAARREQERREREERSKQILLDKFERFKENYLSIKEEIQSTIDEIGECLEIIKVEEDDGFAAEYGGEEEFNSLRLREIRLNSLKEGEKVRESVENKAVFDAMRELYKLLVSKHLVTLQEWISVLIRVDVSDNKFRDSALKEFIDLRNVVKSVQKRCEELGCDLNERAVGREHEEEEDLWEEGKIEVSPAPEIVVEDIKGKGKDNVISKPSSSSTSPRSKLFADAPVLKWSQALDDWGSSRDALANQRGLELDNHWGRVDPDAVISAEKIAELKLHCEVYKEERSTEIQPCLAPLKKGGLCQRRDLWVCPFHGPIVPRDEEGNPIKQKKEIEGEAEREALAGASEAIFDSVDMESSFHDGKEMVEKLAKQAVKNVRERDREVVSSLKRAKLAKVREHNEAVLREAAVASTSYSEAFTESAEASLRGGSGNKVKKATLASMLKNKVTPKDRLAKRLLNNRARNDSSRQVMQGDDSKYREAFPNQW